MVNSFGHSLLSIKEHCKVLKEHDVVSVYFNPYMKKLSVQVVNLEAIKYLLDDDEDTKVRQETHEIDGQPWVRSSVDWCGIEFIQMKQLKGGEADV